MKKVLLIILSTFLSLTLILVPCFASETTSVSSVVFTPVHSVSSSELLSLSGASSYTELPHVTLSVPSGNLYIQYHEDDGIIRFISRSNCSLRVAYVDGVVYTDGWYTSSTQHFMIDSISIDGTYSFSYAIGTTSNVPEDFRTISNFFHITDSNLRSSEGVTASIGFIGQVLNFITSTEGILSLLGVSIALFLIVPFAITKLKELVKGY